MIRLWSCSVCGSVYTLVRVAGSPVPPLMCKPCAAVLAFLGVAFEKEASS